MAAEQRFFFGNVWKNWQFVMSGGMFVCLFVTSLQRLLVAMAAFVAIVVVSGFRENLFLFWRKNISLPVAFFTVLVLVASARDFYSSMIYSSKLKAVAARMGIDNRLAVLLIAATFCAAAVYFLSMGIAFAFKLYGGNAFTGEDVLSYPLNVRQASFVFATSVLTITICSKSSPIYPLNDWVDANCFLTVGKSMLYGKVPYRDLYEQKGPLLYMLHAVAAWISETSFLGVYFLEIIACVAFLFFAYRMMQTTYSSISVLWLLPLAVIVYSAPCFCHGDSAEELCLPFLAFALYSGFRALQSNGTFSFAEGIAIGITSACVLWIKFSMLGFYLGWICVPAIVLIRNGNLAKLFRLLGQIAFGVLLVSAPILIYFAANGALSDLWTAYFYNNLFLYSTASEGTLSSSVLQNLWTGIDNIYAYNFSLEILFLIGVLCLAGKTKWREIWLYILSFAGMFVLVYIGGQHHMYYSLIFSVFAPVGMAALVGVIQILEGGRFYLRLPRRGRCCLTGIFCVLSVAAAFCLCGNTYLLAYEKADMPQYKFAQIIQKNENATLLNYGFLDGGFYTTSGIVPTCRYFCNLNIPLDEIMETQRDVVNAGDVDFVVTRGKRLKSSQYCCVANASLYFEGEERTYYLYQLKQQEGR